MSEYRRLLERAAERVPPSHDAFYRLARRRERRERNRRIVAGAVGAVVAILGTLGVLAAFSREGPVRPVGRVTAPANPNITPPALPRNGRIAFLSGTGAGQFIYSMHADGSRRTRLTAERMHGSSLAWSPDGTRIAFDRGLGEGKGALLVMNADGTPQRTLFDDLGPVDSPTWSPDGKRIAFNSGDGGIYVINADGTGLTHLAGGLDEAGNQVFYSQPDWSPDGKTLVLERHDVTGKELQEIYVMNSDGTRPRRLTTGGRHLGPKWSPDGATIVFFGFKRNFDIYVMNADGTRITPLTGGPGDDYDPEWSPDGKKIVFASNRGGNQDIYMMNADGSGETRLTDGPAADFAPAWQPLR